MSLLPSPVSVGIDAGGSSIRGVLLSCSTGEIINKFQCQKPGNPHVNGFECAVSSIVETLDGLVNQCTVDVAMRSLVIVLSGGDDEETIGRYHRILTQQDRSYLRRGGDSIEVKIVHDACGPVGLLIDGSIRRQHESACGSYAVLVAGTGSVAAMYEMQSQHNELKLLKRVGGRGPKLGDEGSAYSISTTILSNALAIYDNTRSNLYDNKYERSELHQSSMEILKYTYSYLFHERSERRQGLTDSDINYLVAYVHTDECSRDKIASITGNLYVNHARNIIVSESFKQAAEHLTCLLNSITSYHNERITHAPQIILTGGVFQALKRVHVFHQMLSHCLSQYDVYTLSSDYAAAMGAARLSSLYFPHIDLPAHDDTACLQPAFPN